MNKLRENLKKAVECTPMGVEAIVYECEQITDDFTIKFQLFIISNNIVFGKDTWCVFNKEHLIKL